MLIGHVVSDPEIVPVLAQVSSPARAGNALSTAGAQLPPATSAHKAEHTGGKGASTGGQLREGSAHVDQDNTAHPMLQRGLTSPYFIASGVVLCVAVYVWWKGS
jgi:hypothetical protein